MKILNVTQGSPEWKEARAKHFCASDAPAMMGASKYKTRTELLREKATGYVEEVDDFKQALFDKGHAAEAAARLIVEEELGEDLYPVTGTDDAGYLLASFDGINMDGDMGFEHKLWNEELAANVQREELPPMYYWQLEQQCFVAGLLCVQFVCSDGTKEKWASTLYEPVPGRIDMLLDGWAQFQIDLDNYKPVEVLPPVTATPVLALPALTVQVGGSITIKDNLADFGERLNTFIEAIDKNPSDDQAFADAEAAVKTLQAAQDALDSAESSALAQTASIDEMRRTVALYRDMAKNARLSLEKVVKARKQTIREEIRIGGATAVADLVVSLNEAIGKPYMPTIQTDFPGVMKGKRTIASLRDAVDTEVARAKIEANSIANRIQKNMIMMRAIASEHEFLFADEAQIVLKEYDDFNALVELRVSKHKESEAKRLEEERERIRKEEVEKLEAQKRADQAREDAERVDAETDERPITLAQGYAPQNSSDDMKTTVEGIAKVTLFRPTNDAIIEVLAKHYGEPKHRIIQWLINMKMHEHTSAA